MISWDAERVASAAGASLVAGDDGGPVRAVVDTRAIEQGDLFVGLVGEHVDGGRFAADALAAGAWGVLVVAGARVRALRRRGARRGRSAARPCSGWRASGGGSWTRP